MSDSLERDTQSGSATQADHFDTYHTYLQQTDPQQVIDAHTAALSALPVAKQRSIIERFRDELKQSAQAFTHGSTGTGSESGTPGGVGHYFDSMLHGSTGTGPQDGQQHNPLGRVFDDFLHGKTDTHWHDPKHAQEAGQVLGSAAQQAAQSSPGLLQRIFGRHGSVDPATSHDFMSNVLNHNPDQTNQS